MLFFVKVRLDVNKLTAYGKKLNAGEIHTHPVSIYCLKEDPTVGLNIWEAEDQKSLEKALAPHQVYYSEIMEIAAIITPQAAQQILLERLSGNK
jgi:hypothetical protein